MDVKTNCNFPYYKLVNCCSFLKTFFYEYMHYFKGRLINIQVHTLAHFFGLKNKFKIQIQNKENFLSSHFTYIVSFHFCSELKNIGFKTGICEHLIKCLLILKKREREILLAYETLILKKISNKRPMGHFVHMNNNRHDEISLMES